MFFPHFQTSLKDLDADVYELIQLETERQKRRIILIPSESASPVAVREAMGSNFQNIYAEGYPIEYTRWMDEADILDYETQLAFYRRYSDPRYDKGVEYAVIIEALARRRCAEAFAANGITTDDIYVNVQALSGSPANNAVFHALVNPGDTVLSMDLLHGGHLSHGSSANRSGKFFNIVPYTVNPQTGQIDYESIKALALEHKPKMIIGGYSSYPWAVDWKEFRSIADLVGAYLLADIAQVAGLVVAGAYPSPIGYAHVITSTTHKSLYGPRGAIIMTTDPELAVKIDQAIFQGEQGGPHVNVFAALCLTFKLAQTKEFSELQHQVVKNCITLAERLESHGFRIAYGGTNTHLMNLDCKSVIGPDGTPLSGDQAARILDLAGIVVNRNTIPGDLSAANPSGICLGTPWVTQRGFKEQECETLASIIADLLKACAPYSITGRKRPLLRAKVDFEILNEVKVKVRDLAMGLGIDYEPPTHGYPHFYYLDDPSAESGFTIVDVCGEKTESFLRWATSARSEDVEPGGSVRTRLHTPKRPVEATLKHIGGGGQWQLTVASSDAPLVMTWLRDLSDGFVAFNQDDLHKKLPGPVIVSLHGEAAEMPKAESDGQGLDKPWFIGVSRGEGESLQKFDWTEPAEGTLRQTVLHATHYEMGAKMVPFAGWNMPVWYTSVLEEHLATREAAGLFDVCHMGVYRVEGAQACAFLDSVVTNDVALLAVGKSLYAQFLDPDGGVIDDTMIYRRHEDTYLVVVNASNDDKDWAWLNAVREGRVCVDNERPWALVYGRGCRLRNLRDPSEGDEMRVDIALQGPKSQDILLALGCEDITAARLKALPWAGVMQGVFGGFDLVVSRTGYTGERIAYELFVHPEKSVSLWQKLLEVGEPFGLKPVGLGARDSLRTEAGLPLYGHEMAGELGLCVGDAGFAAYVKTHKPWFIGRSAFLAQEAERKGEVVRFRFDDKGVRMAHYGDPVVDRRGRVIGKVTSCAVDQEGYLLGQAYVQSKYTAVGTPIAIFQSAPQKTGKAPAELSVGDRVTIPTPATVLSRFLR